FGLSCRTYQRSAVLCCARADAIGNAQTIIRTAQLRRLQVIRDSGDEAYFPIFWRICLTSSLHEWVGATDSNFRSSCNKGVAPGLLPSAYSSLPFLHLSSPAAIRRWVNALSAASIEMLGSSSCARR